MAVITVTVTLYANLRDEYGIREFEVACDGSLRGLVSRAATKLGDAFFSMRLRAGKGEI
jgi:hypothetical protein